MRASTARERTEFFLRENPVPTVLGALALGVAIGLAIRYSSSSAEKEVEAKSPLANVDLGMLSLPFLWPIFKSVRRKYEDSADAVKDGVERLKKVDVDRYVKPLRKKWKARAHTGAARIAIEAGVLLVPAAIRGTDELRRLAKIRVDYGPPIPLDDLEGQDVREASHEATERLMSEIHRLEHAP